MLFSWLSKSVFRAESNHKLPVFEPAAVPAAATKWAGDVSSQRSCSKARGAATLTSLWTGIIIEGISYSLSSVGLNCQTEAMEASAVACVPLQRLSEAEAWLVQFLRLIFLNWRGLTLLSAKWTKTIPPVGGEPWSLFTWTRLLFFWEEFCALSVWTELFSHG